MKKLEIIVYCCYICVAPPCFSVTFFPAMPLPQGISVQLGICMHLPHTHVHIAYRLLCGGKMQSDRLLRFTKRSVRCCVAKCCLIYCQPYNNILVEPEAESTELMQQWRYLVVGQGRSKQCALGWLNVSPNL